MCLVGWIALSGREHVELVAAKRRIRQLETELAIVRQASALYEEPLSAIAARQRDSAGVRGRHNRGSAEAPSAHHRGVVMDGSGSARRGIV